MGITGTPLIDAIIFLNRIREYILFVTFLNSCLYLKSQPIDT